MNLRNAHGELRATRAHHVRNEDGADRPYRDLAFGTTIQIVDSVARHGTWAIVVDDSLAHMLGRPVRFRLPSLFGWAAV